MYNYIYVRTPRGIPTYDTLYIYIINVCVCVNICRGEAYSMEIRLVLPLFWDQNFFPASSLGCEGLFFPFFFHFVISKCCITCVTCSCVRNVVTSPPATRKRRLDLSMLSEVNNFDHFCLEWCVDYVFKNLVLINDFS